MNTSFLEKIKQWIFLVVGVVALIVGVNLVYRLMFAPYLQIGEPFSAPSVSVDLDFSSLKTKNFFKREGFNAPRAMSQYEAVPWDANNPPAPRNVSVIDAKTGGTLAIFWEEPLASVDGVNIYRSQNFLEPGVQIASNLPVQGKYVDVAVQNGIPYFYTLVSFVKKGNTPVESQGVAPVSGIATDTVSPGVLKNITLTSGKQSGSVFLEWQNPLAEDFSAVRIYRSQVSGNLGEKIMETSGTSFEDSGLINGTVYYYTLTAVDASGNESSRVLRRSSVGNTSPF